MAVQIQPLHSNIAAMSCPVLHGHFVFLEGGGLLTEKFTREPCPSFIQTGNRSKPHEQEPLARPAWTNPPKSLVPNENWSPTAITIWKFRGLG